MADTVKDPAERGCLLISCPGHSRPVLILTRMLLVKRRAGNSFACIVPNTNFLNALVTHYMKCCNKLLWLTFLHSADIRRHTKRTRLRPLLQVCELLKRAPYFVHDSTYTLWRPLKWTPLRPIEA